VKRGSRTAAVCLFLGLLAACGIKGDPAPPNGSADADYPAFEAISR
jgi:predicted small lipoprotein YifL